MAFHQRKKSRSGVEEIKNRIGNIMKNQSNVQNAKSVQVAISSCGLGAPKITRNIDRKGGLITIDAN